MKLTPASIVLVFAAFMVYEGVVFLLSHGGF